MYPASLNFPRKTFIKTFNSTMKLNVFLYNINISLFVPRGEKNLIAKIDVVICGNGNFQLHQGTGVENCTFDLSFVQIYNYDV